MSLFLAATLGPDTIAIYSLPLTSNVIGGAENLDHAEIVQPFGERAAAIAAEASPQRRALLTDSR